jgi:hypothetical protein
MGASVISETDAIAILNSDGVIDRLKVSPDRIEQGDLYLINDRMLLVLIGHGDSVEAHIAQPRKYWKYIHKDIKQALIFIQSLGYNQVYTNVRSELKTTLNLLNKHGFNRIETINNEVILQWELKQRF